MPASRFQYLALVVQILYPVWADCEDTECLLQVDRGSVQKLTDKKQAPEVCGPAVPWPCTSFAISGFPLQAVNVGSCSRSEIRRLDIGPAGTYTTLCYIENECLNACGIDPKTNHMYCNQRPGDQQLVRVDCFLDVVELETRAQEGTLGDYVAVEGKLCFFGGLPNMFQADFDLDGNYWFLNAKSLFEVEKSTLDILRLTGGTTTETVNTLIPGADTAVPGLTSLNPPGNIADIVVVEHDFREGAGLQKYAIGCWEDKAWVQQVSDSATSADYFILTMQGTDPFGTGAYGATWAFLNKVYCADNDGNGVFEILLSTASISGNSGTVSAPLVSGSIDTSSNDGMNCLERTPSPFDTTTTTTKMGGGDGDPHIHTFDGEHYLLLNQGSFSFWRFSGVNAEVSSKQVPVDFQIYAHYSGHLSFTKGLLLVDRSGAADRVLELTSDDCRWRTKTSGSWQPVEDATLLTGGDEMTAFNMAKTTDGQKMHVEFLMKAKAPAQDTAIHGFKKIGNLYASCKPHHHINMKMAMFSKEDVPFVKGQLGKHKKNDGAISLLGTKGQKMQTDQDFLISNDWTELGGSVSAQAYLKHVDEEGVALLQTCSTEAEAAAKSTCTKFLGQPGSGSKGPVNFNEMFEDCVFDVCVGGGEPAAELAAEILNAF